MSVKVEVKTLDDLQPDPNNVNKHTQKGHALVENSLRKRGAFRSVAAAGKGVEKPVVMAGNLTIEKARDAGFEEVIFVHTNGRQLVSVIRDDIEPGSPEAIALGIEDNESGKQSYSPDIEVIAALAAGDNAILSALRKGDKIFDGMIKGMGLKDEAHDAPADVDRAAELLEKWKCETGQLWMVGEHRLLIGDSYTDIPVLMGGEKADCILTDPPYGMNLNTDYSDMPETRIASKTYERVEGDDKDFDASPFIELFDYCKEQFWWGADYYYPTLPPHGSWIVWDKRNENSDGLVGNHFEVCWSRTSHRRRMIRVHWSGVNARNQGTVRSHPTEKSVKVLCEIINDYTDEGAIVVDFFGGVGTTLMACESLKRKCRMIEKDPAYVAVALERMATAFPALEIKKL